MENKITQKELQKRIKDKTLKFAGFITEKQIKSLKKGYVFFKTQSKTDILGNVFGNGNRDIYIYKEVL